MKSNLTLFDFLMHVPVIELVVPKHKVKSYCLLRFFLSLFVLRNSISEISVKWVANNVCLLQCILLLILTHVTVRYNQYLFQDLFAVSNWVIFFTYSAINQKLPYLYKSMIFVFQKCELWLPKKCIFSVNPATSCFWNTLRPHNTDY